jgi:hypothetical protein
MISFVRPQLSIMVIFSNCMFSLIDYQKCEYRLIVMISAKLELVLARQYLKSMSLQRE